MLLLLLAAATFAFCFALPSPPAGQAQRHLIAKLKRDVVKTSPALRIGNGTQATVFDAAAAVSGDSYSHDSIILTIDTAAPASSQGH